MKRALITLGAVLAVVAVSPAAAQAHHVDLNRSTITCALVNNVPTLQVSVLYVDFEPYNKPIKWTLYQDSTKITEGLITEAQFPGTSYTHAFSQPATPGSFAVTYHAVWGKGNEAKLREFVVCPAPVPPAICNGVEVPHGTPCLPPPPVTIQYDCTGQVMAPGATPAVCAPPKKVKKKTCPQANYRITVHPRNARSGFITFRLRGPHAKNIVWRINGRVIGTRDRANEYRRDRGRMLTVLVSDRRVFPQLPGVYRVTTHAKTKCGKSIIKLRYRNIDPPLARVARSSWG